MPPFDIVPINFSLTDRAANEISRMTRHLSETEGQELVAALFWNEAYDEVERKLIDRHFVLGWYELSKSPLETTQTVNGVELLFIVTNQQAENFRGKTIDFDEDKFRFLDA